MRKTWFKAGYLLRAFADNQRGAILLFVAFALLPLIGALGVATDAARGYAVKERLSRAIDSAGLAGARVIESPDLPAHIQKFFDANFPPGFMDAVVSGPSYQVTNNNERLTLTAQATIKTSFMSVLGHDAIVVSASTEVAVGGEFLDLVIALDMSGSMTGSSGSGGQTRIEAARVATLALVDVLFGSEETRPELRIGFVPWNSKVNVGIDGQAFNSAGTTTEAVSGFTNPVNDDFQNEIFKANNSPVELLFQPPVDWVGCVYARYSSDGNPDNDGDTSYGPATYDNKDWMAWEPVGADTSSSSGSGSSKKKKKKKKKKKSGSSCGAACSSCLVHGVTPLQSSKSTIVTQINGLTTPQGNTVIPQGLAWAWRVLMPETPFVDAGSGSTFTVRRAIVLMTDGENCAGNGDAYKDALGDCSGAQAELDARLREIATKAKAQGIEIYTIQFANNGSALQTLMKDVATLPSKPYYQYAPDGDALEDAFEEVGGKLTNLHIAK